MLVVELLYATAIFFLSLYGLNNLLLALIYLRRGRSPMPGRQPLPDPPLPDEWPRITVQLPIYNELHTAERLLDAVAGLDYPRHRLEIQVLDDSTDGTRQLVAGVVARLRAQGIDAVHLVREDRAGFKAGALAAGLEQARGEFIAIFDADFIPEPDFLQRLVPHFVDPAVGCIQARWGHVNRDYSALTQVQALGVDGHFVVQQTARSRAGLFLNFNGTAGIWRRTCIEDAGGWRGDTLTEDLDLSYRAQLCGWRIVYLPGVVVPAELPAQIGAFKHQQARWAQGSIETALKLVGPLLRSDQPLAVKLEGVMHLTGYLIHPLMLAVILLTLPMSFSRSWVLLAIPWLVVSAAGPPFLYVVAQLADRGEGRRRLRYMPLLIMVGMGLCLNNTAAVLRGLLGIRRDFQRTPKFDLRQAADTWLGSVYALGSDWMVWPELGLSILLLAFLILHRARWTFVPWLLLYAGGFAYVSGVNLIQTYRRRRFLQAARQPR